MKPAQQNMKNRRSLETLRSLHGFKKVQYIWDYYKLPLVIIGVLLYIIVYIFYRRFSYKDTILYTALVNVSAGENLTEKLGEGFMDVMNLNASSNQLYIYSGLYLTDDENNPYHEYTYASRMKILASIDGELLDVVLMNKEAFDAFAQNGYLYDLDKLLKEEYAAFYEDIKPFIVDNIFIEEDNSFELIFDSSIPYNAVTEEYPMGVDLSQAQLIKQSELDGIVYFGIIGNSPRKDTAIAYLQYLFYGE